MLPLFASMRIPPPHAHTGDRQQQTHVDLNNNSTNTQRRPGKHRNHRRHSAAETTSKRDGSGDVGGGTVAVEGRRESVAGGSDAAPAPFGVVSSLRDSVSARPYRRSGVDGTAISTVVTRVPSSLITVHRAATRDTADDGGRHFGARLTHLGRTLSTRLGTAFGIIRSPGVQQPLSSAVSADTNRNNGNNNINNNNSASRNHRHRHNNNNNNSNNSDAEKSRQNINDEKASLLVPIFVDGPAPPFSGGGGDDNEGVGDGLVVEAEERQCRICLLTTTPATAAMTTPSAGGKTTPSRKRGRRMVAPCRCAGTVQYVHIACLTHWIEVSARKMHSVPQCELCGYRFRRKPFIDLTSIHFPYVDWCDRILNLLFLFLVAIMFLCGWVAVHYLRLSERRPLIRSNRHSNTKRLLTDNDVTVIIASILFFAAFFIALFTQYRADVTVFRILGRLWSTNRNWRIRDYVPRCDDESGPDCGDGGRDVERNEDGSAVNVTTNSSTEAATASIWYDDEEKMAEPNSAEDLEEELLVTEKQRQM